MTGLQLADRIITSSGSEHRERHPRRYQAAPSPAKVKYLEKQLTYPKGVGADLAT